MAISSPLREASIDGAHGVLLSIQGGSDLGLFEINEAAQLVANSAAVDANIIFGAVIDDALGDEVRVTVIAAGFDETRPGRSAAVTAVPAPGGRSPAAQPAGSGGSNGAGGSNGGAPGASGHGPATALAPATAAWAGNGGASAAPGAAEPSADDSASAAPALGAAHGGASAPGISGTWPASSSPSASGGAPGGSGYATGTGDTQAAAPRAQGAGPSGHGSQAGATDPIAEVPVQPASDVPAGYVPAPVSFVSDDDDEYGAKPGYGGYDRDRGGEAAQGGAAPGWKDSGRAGKQDKVFDVQAGRRRPVVFEEEDDLDVPDFLK
jgi:cell division protein FtsZ